MTIKDIIRIFFIIGATFLAGIILVLKPYKTETVDLTSFTEYYSEAYEEEDNSGIGKLDENFILVEREYDLSELRSGEDNFISMKKEYNKNELDSTIDKGTENLLENNETTKIAEKVYKIPTLETYVVKKGDTLSKISESYNIRLDILKALNPKVSTILMEGQKLKVIRENGLFYKVKRGDSLSKISDMYEIKIDMIKKYNNLSSDNLRLGATLYIPNPKEDAILGHIRAVKLNTDNKIQKINDLKTFIMPVKWAGITSGFGSRTHPVLGRKIFHQGVDFRARYVPLYAPKSGRVTFAGTKSGYGKILIIDHGNGYESRSAHLQEMYVKVGDRVAPGQHIGKTGATGRVTGPHLHFEIRKNGKAYNPMNYIKR